MVPSTGNRRDLILRFQWVSWYSTHHKLLSLINPCFIYIINRVKIRLDVAHILFQYLWLGSLNLTILSVIFALDELSFLMDV